MLSYTKTGALVEYTLAEMEAVHPFLHKFLCATYYIREYTGFGQLKVAQTCLEYWSDYLPKRMDIGGVQVNVSKQFRIVRWDVNEETICLDVGGCTLVRVNQANYPAMGAGEEWLVPFLAEKSYFDVSYAWIDDHFPGAVGRFKSALLLDIDVTDNSAMILYGNDPQETKVVLPETME